MPSKSLRSLFRFPSSLIIFPCFVGVCMMHVAPASGKDLVKTRSAAELGDIRSELAMGDAYFQGQGVPKDAAQAAYWYEKAANAGDALAQNQIGYFYQAGIGVAADGSRAVHWFQLSAANGDSDAKVNLGIAFFWGTGVKRDPQMAKHLFEEAARAGNSSAMTDLGDMYYYGDGATPNERLAKSWYEEAIKKHDSLADYRMAILLSTSAAGPSDLQRALVLFRESSADGFVPAMHALGLLLINHPELCKSHQEALRAMNAAADAGMWRSSAILGVLARDGKWVSKDPASAYFHFRAAELQGGTAASQIVEDEIDKLSQALSADELAHIDAQAKAWAGMHNTPLVKIYRDGSQRNRFPLYAQVEAATGAHAGSLIPRGLSSEAEHSSVDLTEAANCQAGDVRQSDSSAATPQVCSTSD